MRQLRISQWKTVNEGGDRCKECQNLRGDGPSGQLRARVRAVLQCCDLNHLTVEQTVNEGGDRCKEGQNLRGDGPSGQIHQQASQMDGVGATRMQPTLEHVKSEVLMCLEEWCSQQQAHNVLDSGKSVKEDSTKIALPVVKLAGALRRWLAEQKGHSDLDPPNAELAVAQVDRQPLAIEHQPQAQGMELVLVPELALQSPPLQEQADGELQGSGGGLQNRVQQIQRERPRQGIADWLLQYEQEEQLGSGEGVQHSGQRIQSESTRQGVADFLLQHEQQAQGDPTTLGDGVQAQERQEGQGGLPQLLHGPSHTGPSHSPSHTGPSHGPSHTGPSHGPGHTGQSHGPSHMGPSHGPSHMRQSLPSAATECSTDSMLMLLQAFYARRQPGAISKAKRNQIMRNLKDLDPGLISAIGSDGFTYSKHLGSEARPSIYFWKLGGEVPERHWHVNPSAVNLPEVLATDMEDRQSGVVRARRFTKSEVGKQKAQLQEIGGGGGGGDATGRMGSRSSWRGIGSSRKRSEEMEGDHPIEENLPSDTPHPHAHHPGAHHPHARPRCQSNSGFCLQIGSALGSPMSPSLCRPSSHMGGVPALIVQRLQEEQQGRGVTALPDHMNATVEGDAHPSPPNEAEAEGLGADVGMGLGGDIDRGGQPEGGSHQRAWVRVSRRSEVQGTGVTLGGSGGEDGGRDGDADGDGARERGQQCAPTTSNLPVAVQMAYQLARRLGMPNEVIQSASDRFTALTTRLGGLEAMRANPAHGLPLAKRKFGLRESSGLVAARERPGRAGKLIALKALSIAEARKAAAVKKIHDVGAARAARGGQDLSGDWVGALGEEEEEQEEQDTGGGGSGGGSRAYQRDMPEGLHQSMPPGAILSGALGAAARQSEKEEEDEGNIAAAADAAGSDYGSRGGHTETEGGPKAGSRGGIQVLVSEPKAGSRAGINVSKSGCRASSPTSSISASRKRKQAGSKTALPPQRTGVASQSRGAVAGRGERRARRLTRSRSPGPRQAQEGAHDGATRSSPSNSSGPRQAEGASDSGAAHLSTRNSPRLRQTEWVVDSAAASRSPWNSPWPRHTEGIANSGAPGMSPSNSPQPMRSDSREISGGAQRSASKSPMPMQPEVADSGAARMSPSNSPRPLRSDLGEVSGGAQQSASESPTPRQPEVVDSGAARMSPSNTPQPPRTDLGDVSGGSQRSASESPTPRQPEVADSGAASIFPSSSLRPPRTDSGELSGGAPWPGWKSLQSRPSEGGEAGTGASQSASESPMPRQPEVADSVAARMSLSNSPRPKKKENKERKKKKKEARSIDAPGGSSAKGFRASVGDGREEDHPRDVKVTSSQKVGRSGAARSHNTSSMPAVVGDSREEDHLQDVKVTSSQKVGRSGAARSHHTSSMPAVVGDGREEEHLRDVKVTSNQKKQKVEGSGAARSHHTSSVPAVVGDGREEDYCQDVEVISNQKEQKVERSGAARSHHTSSVPAGVEKSRAEDLRQDVKVTPTKKQKVERSDATGGSHHTRSVPAFVKDTSGKEDLQVGDVAYKEKAGSIDGVGGHTWRTHGAPTHGALPAVVEGRGKERHSDARAVSQIEKTARSIAVGGSPLMGASMGAGGSPLVGASMGVGGSPLTGVSMGVGASISVGGSPLAGVSMGVGASMGVGGGR
eukprot:gene30896-35948_t